MPSEAPGAAASALPLKPKLVLKIAPDLDDSELAAIAAVVRSSGVDGVIVSNTTVRRPTDLSDRTCFFSRPMCSDTQRNIREFLTAMAHM